MDKYFVYCDPDALEELCSRTPYNLKKDLKNIDETTLAKIAEDVANEVYYGIQRPPTIVSLRWSKKRQTACAKIRVVDVARDAGKSNGYRCIVLVDFVNHCIFLLHVYRHGHGEEENIDKKSQNMLDKLVDEYADSLEESTKSK